MRASRRRSISTASCATTSCGSGANVADIQVNLVPQRRTQGAEPRHRQTRSPARRGNRGKFGARVAVAEVPPGPPVLQTLVAEIYGPNETDRHALARKVSDIFKSTPGVVDVDWYIEADQPKARFVIDKEKAALHGISAETISQTLRIAVGGESVDLLHVPREKEDVNIMLIAAFRERPRRRNCSRCACAPATPMRCPSPALPAPHR